MTLFIRLKKTLKFNDIIEKIVSTSKYLKIYYKDGLVDAFISKQGNNPFKSKSKFSKYYTYILDDQYDIYPFETEEKINEISTKVLDRKFLINQVINLHRLIRFFQDKIKTDFIFHNKTHNNAQGIRISIIKALKNKETDLNEETIIKYFPWFNKDYHYTLSSLNNKIQINSINDLMNNNSVKQWCQENNKKYNEGNTYFYDTLDWSGKYLITRQSNELTINEIELEKIKKLPHCIFITDVLKEELSHLIKPQKFFDIKIKLKYQNYSLRAMIW